MVRLSQEDIKILMGRDKTKNYEWRKANLKRCDFYLNKTNDKDVIDHLDKQANKREYIINLIREDIKKESD